MSENKEKSQIIIDDVEKEPFKFKDSRKEMVSVKELTDQMSSIKMDVSGLKIMIEHNNEKIGRYKEKLRKTSAKANELEAELSRIKKLDKLNTVLFKLNDDFMQKYIGKQPKWGDLGYITYKRTYARIIEGENRKEEFWETIRRVVEGCFAIQKDHCTKLGLPFDYTKAQRKAQRMYEKIWDFKMVPAGRGLWIMGTDYIKKHGSMALNNCAFVSTNDIDIKGSKAFCFLMDALMVGVGVGFDTRGASKIIVKQPTYTSSVYKVPDSREGWVYALGLTIDGFFFGKDVPIFDYTLIRPAGLPIKGFGGVSSGYEALKNMLDEVSDILKNRIGNPITSLDILDIMNNIAKCVIAGNVRRSAEIALGEYDDEQFILAKRDKEKLSSHRWASNNSIIGKKGMDYSFIVEHIIENGEPSVFWLDNAKSYSRMINKSDNKDKQAMGVNPCITGDTIVAVADGRNSVKIEQLYKENERFLVYSKESVNIANVIYQGKRNVIKLILSNNSFIKCTPEHLLYTKDGRLVKAIDSLNEKLYKIYDFNKIDVIVSEIVETCGKIDVYDLQVENEHNFYIITKSIGVNSLYSFGVLIHNCGEMTLNSFEMCNLCETFPSNHENYGEFKETLKYAYLYSKTVSLVNTTWEEVNAEMQKNRRMGISQTGIIQAFMKHGRRTVLEWSNRGYRYLKELDEEYSNWLCVPKSIKLTTVKPSGTVSLLAGVTAGIHYPHAEYYIRRIRMAKSSELIPILKQANYHIEKDEYSPNTMVVEFPLKTENFKLSKYDVSIWEQAINASDYQRYWSDNQVSITITFKSEEKDEIKKVLECFEDKLKSVSFLPLIDHGYKQAPYETITKETYEKLKSKIKPLDLSNLTEKAIGEKFCDAEGICNV